LVEIWYIFPVLVCLTKKNLATLIHDASEEKKMLTMLFLSFNAPSSLSWLMVVISALRATSGEVWRKRKNSFLGS
jgi:Na+-translocating ferredoxin:NAD+ oxidoreductase RnfD subunit